jgi:hypothetical protein
MCRVCAIIRSRSAPERGSPEAAWRNFPAFSPLPALAVDFGDSAVLQKFVDSMT